MIKNQSQCPCCNECVVAYDWDDDKIIFNPDQAKPGPCEHVAYIGVYCLTLGDMHAHRHTIWLHPSADPPLAEYMRHMHTGTEKPPGIYEIKDATHDHQHASATDRVTFCGIYAPEPKDLLRVCAENMKHWYP